MELLIDGTFAPLRIRSASRKSTTGTGATSRLGSSIALRFMKRKRGALRSTNGKKSELPGELYDASSGPSVRRSPMRRRRMSAVELMPTCANSAASRGESKAASGAAAAPAGRRDDHDVGIVGVVEGIGAEVRAHGLHDRSNDRYVVS